MDDDMDAGYDRVNVRAHTYRLKDESQLQVSRSIATDVAWRQS